MSEKQESIVKRTLKEEKDKKEKEEKEKEKEKKEAKKSKKRKNDDETPMSSHSDCFIPKGLNHTQETTFLKLINKKSPKEKDSLKVF